MLEFRRIARRRALLLQYERDERDPFTKAYGDVVRGYATDDTEAMRTRGLNAFSEFPNAIMSRSEHSSKQRLDREALVGRAASSSYLPQSGPNAQRLRRDLLTLFERFERRGAVELMTVTYVLVAGW